MNTSTEVPKPRSVGRLVLLKALAMLYWDRATEPLEKGDDALAFIVGFVVLVANACVLNHIYGDEQVFLSIFVLPAYALVKLCAIALYNTIREDIEQTKADIERDWNHP